MYQNKKILALVPARSGSTRIKDKNMQKICGVSLIGWAGMCLRALEWIDAKVISTDSEEYAREGENHGLEVLMRPEALSRGQHRSIIPTMLWSLDELQKRYNTKFDILLLVEPTSPTRTLKDLEGIINLFTTMPNAEAVISVGQLNKRYHPEHILKSTLNDKLCFVSDYEEGCRKGDMFWWTGIGYAYSPKALKEQMSILPENSYLYLIDRPVVNIDDPVDLLIAEQMMRKGTDWLKESLAS
jgi:CMP-N,N'-diacetyllegionaminic acid synthase